MARKRKAKLAVWKFASCDGCQLSLLNCEDELLAIAGQVEIAYFLEASRATIYGCSEAPRGILYHRYRIDDRGTILDAKIVPPTSQNQKTIENDLRHLVPKYLDLSRQQLTWQCEQAIRNYDPCISCATHFLRLEIAQE
jgi:coenzyme F420-reducing hydrogenase alpha subunit